MADLTHPFMLFLLYISMACVADSRIIDQGSGDMCWLECPDTVLQPVCGTNGVTYQNECRLLRVQKCNGLPLRKKYDGPCFQKRFPSSIKSHQTIQKNRSFCGGYRLNICSMIGGLCVKDYKQQKFVCMRQPAHSTMVNIAI